MINLYKFKQVRSLSTIFSSLLVRDFEISNCYIVPLPTVPAHVRVRGFDHIGRIAKEISTLSGCKVLKLLARNKNTVQVGKNKEVRASQSMQAYRYNNKNSVPKDAKIVLLDDIWTTGSSMKAAREILLKEGYENISIMLIAKSV